MEIPHTGEKEILRGLISNELFDLADSIDKHAAKELVSFHRLTNSFDLSNPEGVERQRKEAHGWFSTRGGFGDQTHPHAQELLVIAALQLNLNPNDFKEYFRNDSNRDGYSIKNYSLRIQEKTSRIREVAAQLAYE